MVAVELRCECITHSFLIDECWIKEFFSGYIVNFVKHVRSGSPDVGRRRAVHNPSLEVSILNVVADRLESNTRDAAHQVSVSHQTV
ncbi:hypothetical protein TNCV_4762471 [Trichonephila clavipes]|nr:hypothetical protein TNCV_4762471 [Trichonephila clavipes]